MRENQFIFYLYIIIFNQNWTYKICLHILGEMWRKQRKMIQPAFHFAVMNNIGGIVNRKAEVLLQILELQADSQWFDILPIMYACSLDIIVGKMK